MIIHSLEQKFFQFLFGQDHQNMKTYLLEDLRVVGHKSTALAAQNFMMSMAGYGYDTCPMEGFDSKRLKQILKLPSASQISMVIGCGIRKTEGVYGERFRIPFKEVYREL